MPLSRLLPLTLSLSLVACGLLSGKEPGPRPLPWSFAPLRKHSLPAVSEASWPKRRLDYFVLARLQKEGLKPSPQASETVLARRLSFDLLGLPPEPVLAQWPQARRVDALLGRAQYGERWARHWLDLVRYTDQVPNWLDSTRYAYRYRDWVVQAFNEDMRSDRFVVAQLAADALPGSRPEDRVAMGFVGLSPSYFKELQLPPEIIRTTVADEWEEHVDALGRTFLGLTLACARCHDHKSDPISARDYYALAGVFASIQRRELPTMDDQFWLPVKKAREEVARIEADIAALNKKKPAPADLKTQVKAMQTRIEKIRNATPHYNMPMANGVVDAALYVVDAPNKKGTKLDFREGMARDLELQMRGNPNDLGEKVPRRFLEAFPGPGGKPRPLSKGSGRLDLAKALVEDAQALSARVIVNRVWKHHFGRGLVDTPSEFGNLGEAPSHPELLDDLAFHFVANGWSIKWLHREILNSATWQQSSQAAASQQRDPDNRLLSRMPRRRLEWEPWRDALLFASGELDLSVGGPALSAQDVNTRRRSLYALSDRQDMDAMLRIHDVPDPGAHNPWRPETLSPLQGLFALNSPFMLTRSQALGKRLQNAGEKWPQLAMQAALQREASDQEVAVLREFMQGRSGEPEAWAELAQALLCSNEMMFVD